jgi:uncharacterized protein
MEFEWDEAKAARNLEKHGVAFESVLVFDWSGAIVRLDVRWNYGEPRWRALHIDSAGTPYVVVFTERRGRYRIISLRRAHAREVRKWAK